MSADDPDARDEPVVSRPEMDALMEGMREEKSARASTAQNLDLMGGDRLLRSLIGPLDPLGERFAERARSVFARSLRVVPAVSAEPAEIASSTGTRALLEEAALVVLLRVGDGGMAYLAVDAALCFAVVERRFGGSPGASAPPARGLTPLERKLAGELAQALAGELTPASADLGGLRFTPERTLARLDPAQLPATDAAAMVCAWRFTAGPLVTTLRLVLPAASLESLRHWAATRPAGMAPSSHLARMLCGAEVEICARMGQATLDLAGLVALAAGDVIRLDTPEGSPIAVLVEGTEKLRGKPVIAHGNLAVEIV